MIQIKNLKEAELFGAIINTAAQANRFTKTISRQLIEAGNGFDADRVRSNYTRLRSYIDNLCTSGHVSFNTAASGLIRAINQFVQECGDVLDDAMYSLDRPGIDIDFLDLSDLTCEVSGLMSKYDDYITWFYTTVVNHLTDGSIKPVDPDVDNTDIDNFLNKVSMQEALQDIVDHTPHQDFKATPLPKMSDDEVKNKLQEVADKADDDKSLDTVSDEDVNKMLIDAANSNKEEDDDPFKDAIEASDANDEDEDPFKDPDDAESKPVKPETTHKKSTKKKQTKTKSSKKS